MHKYASFILEDSKITSTENGNSVFLVLKIGVLFRLHAADLKCMQEYMSCIDWIDVNIGCGKVLCGLIYHV